MARRNSLNERELTDTSFFILLSLTEPKHGYLIMQEIEKMTEGAVSIGPASLYTTIRKLSEAGLIRPAPGTETKKKTYLITTEGKNLLNEDIVRREQIVRTAKDYLSERENAE
ncbi:MULTISPECIES: PadR family transcriptional regulator [Salimicrobium]|uniref:PadR family transcriptional regulator n=3 Tax=Salimicrobium TaxID=351195 RepID=K2GJI8_9BACI|nr:MULTISPECIES: PadR family transcriptional regulator [Salimicrobium]AKG04858.1 PadR family transcriptional regulator [Salimicrobium jeotgali]EKE30604.1 PadR family transcriptional regulator [Salimicrobium jeotgali]MBM7696838.1 DNA-binding PadR family transcriptional regulator [Salimicrobium jeotgali]SDX41117.1 DNA-binding transcriptional regulator, PadR family [Salimicrobium album]SIS46282.1 transcriptional regulator, PadR family [Salimicrobium salexigens]